MGDRSRAMNRNFEEIAAGTLAEALDKLKAAGGVPDDFEPKIVIERPKNPDFGDFGCALPMLMCKATRTAPAICGRNLMDKIQAPPGIFDEISFAPPGYINFRVSPTAWFEGLQSVCDIPDVGHGQKVLLEFVSANPTGPLHAGHARGAVLGDIVADRKSVV